MYKKATFPIAILFMTLPAFAQTAPQIEKAITDPKRAENEAKADVYLHRRPAISNDMQKTSGADTKAAVRKKKKGCRKAARN